MNLPTGIARALLQQAEQVARHLPMPPVAALHMPGQGQAASGHEAEFCAIELADGSVGLSYVLLGHTLQALLQAHGQATGAERLAGADPLTLAQGLVDGHAVARALALAALNAMTDSAWRRLGYTPPAAGNSLADVQLGPDDHLGMIGFFPPLVSRVQAAGGRLTVVEMDAATVARQQQRFPQVHVTLQRQAIAACNVVVGTSTMLLNDTLDDMLAAAPAAQRFAVIGPSAGLWPDELFRRGVTQMGGTRVTDAAALAAAMREGAPWSRATQKFVIDRSTWPGWQALLAHAPPATRD
ncbi:MAG: hypothetical protein LW854_16470 [Rubrivivax sp.]|jgi:uncharacterized protein (DUF4213/DUF364 family)|nr:hypothetical protein [Rubrivivax sp.]